ncbi:MAG: DUF4416 family protein [Planctomycetia bacterium]|nr:DUF4416 family protein [Planctomycetia bacterium]
MGETHSHPPVLLLVAVITRHAQALDWARAKCVEKWGPVALESPTFDFVETNYYEPTMGPGLGKTFLTFACGDQARGYDPGELAATKHLTNAWEAEYAALGRHAEARPLNLDPGYITPAKLVLASTKDHAHRIYLGQGMFAEITLFYKHKAWQKHEYTFPDYTRADFHAFFSRCRERLRKQGG